MWRQSSQIAWHVSLGYKSEQICKWLVSLNLWNNTNNSKPAEKKFSFGGGVSFIRLKWIQLRLRMIAQRHVQISWRKWLKQSSWIKQKSILSWISHLLCVIVILPIINALAAGPSTLRITVMNLQKWLHLKLINMLQAVKTLATCSWFDGRTCWWCGKGCYTLLSLLGCCCLILSQNKVIKMKEMMK